MSKGGFMNKNLLEAQWVQIRDIIKEKFSHLSDEDIREINGRYDQLIAKLQQKYGYSQEEAEERIRNWNFDKFGTSSARVIREDKNERVDRERVDRERERSADNSSIFKWILGLGIPLALLATYLSTSRPMDTEATRSPTVVQERVIQETAADRVISTGIRDRLLSQQNLSLALQNVRISTNDGIVTLSGTVPNAASRDLIVTSAENFAGVRQVVNNLEIR